MTRAPAVYRMTAHIFEGIWSPNTANYALKQVARNFARDATVTNAIAKNFYVDYLLKSCETDQEAISLIKNLKPMLTQARFSPISKLQPTLWK